MYLAKKESRRVRSIYSNKLGKALAESIDAQMLVPPAEQIQIFEELAIIRDIAAEAVRVYAATRDIYESQPNEKNSDRVLQAGLITKEYLKEVISVAEAAARIEAHAREKISLGHLAHAVNQIIIGIYEIVGPHVEIARAIEQNIRKHITVASAVSGTTITPDEDVIDMDATIPKG